MTAESSHWTLAKHGRVAVLSFERPPLHTMTLAAMTELAEHLDSLAEQNEEISVVVLAGGTEGYFIAHADLDDLALYANGGSPPGDPRAWSRATAALENMPQPTIAAIDGQAWGGGCEVSLACTIRLGSERAHLGLPEVTIGIIPGAGATQRLPRLLNPAIAAELVLTGRIVQADEALRIGLLNAVLPAEGFLEAVLDWCGPMAENEPAAVFAGKRAVVAGVRVPIEDGLRLERHLFRDLNASDNAKAQNAAFGRS